MTSQMTIAGWRARTGPNWLVIRRSRVDPDRAGRPAGRAAADERRMASQNRPELARHPAIERADASADHARTPPTVARGPAAIARAGPSGTARAGP
ncbi:hypothetical protein, partial [Brachybacterium phenoliresistens]|uniref:hypothetical protein n=1 Tax=Brachybacterium phenoliresistens TaxID=396014 RepID=UPI001E432440